MRLRRPGKEAQIRDDDGPMLPKRRKLAVEDSDDDPDDLISDMDCHAQMARDEAVPPSRNVNELSTQKRRKLVVHDSDDDEETNRDDRVPMSIDQPARSGENVNEVSSLASSLSFEEQLAMAISLSEAETQRNATTTEQTVAEPEDDDPDLRAAIEASLKDMSHREAPLLEKQAADGPTPPTRRLGRMIKRPQPEASETKTASIKSQSHDTKVQFDETADANVPMLKQKRAAKPDFDVELDDLSEDDEIENESYDEDKVQALLDDQNYALQELDEIARNADDELDSEDDDDDDDSSVDEGDDLLLQIIDGSVSEHTVDEPTLGVAQRDKISRRDSDQGNAASAVRSIPTGEAKFDRTGILESFYKTLSTRNSLPAHQIDRIRTFVSSIKAPKVAERLG